jgi:hypothetical protein
MASAREEIPRRHELHDGLARHELHGGRAPRRTQPSSAVQREQEKLGLGAAESLHFMRRRPSASTTLFLANKIPNPARAPGTSAPATLRRHCDRNFACQGQELVGYGGDGGLDTGYGSLTHIQHQHTIDDGAALCFPPPRASTAMELMATACFRWLDHCGSG